MITKLAISNFRSLGNNVVIRLGRLNFLVGTNGSGKSNVLLALSLVREAVRIGLPGAIAASNGIEAVRRYSSGRPRNVKIDLDISLANGQAKYGFEISGDRSEEYRVKREWAMTRIKDKTTGFEIDSGAWQGPDNLRPNLDSRALAITALGGDARFKPLWGFLANMTVYSINPAVLRKPRKYSSETPMKPLGDNWESILYRQKKTGWKNDFAAALEKLTGDIDDIRVTRASGFLMAQFRHRARGEKAKKWFGVDLESDGTLRVSGLLTALLQEPPLPVIGMEEPELAVHPGALPLIHDHLSKAASRSQVIATTQSPLLLDCLDFKKSRVFLVQRKGVATAVYPLSEHHRGAVRDHLMTLGKRMISGDLQLPLFGD